MYKEFQENITNNHITIFRNLQEFSHCCIYLSYIRHQISASTFTFGGVNFKIKTRKEFPTFMLEYFSTYVELPKLKKNNTQHSM